MNHPIQKNRMAALLLALCIVAVFSLSALFVVSHADHECTGTDCIVCHEISACLSTLRHLSERAGGSGIQTPGTPLILSFLLLPTLLAGVSTHTLILLKIRLNN